MSNEKLNAAIRQALVRHPEGLDRLQLQMEAGAELFEAHQFRRVLAGLKGQGLLREEGATSNRRYFPVAAAPPSSGAEPWSFSDEGRRIVAMVEGPRLSRKPCSYDRGLLDAYHPNHTFYLSETDRRRLAVLGCTPDANLAAGTYARRIMERLLVDLSWNSSRLEGNTYSLLDTERLFREGSAPGGKDARETQMILNHKRAIEFMIEGAGELTLTPMTLRALHGTLAENLMDDPRDEGGLRDTMVGISGSVFIPLGVPSLIQEIFEQLLQIAQAISDPFEQAFFLLVHIPYLQPFADVNKRTSRLAANLPLVKANLQPLSFVDVPREAYTLATLAVYEVRRLEALREVFLLAYQCSAERYRALRQALPEPDPFRLRHREALRTLVREAVQERVPPGELPRRIAQYLQGTTLLPADHARFQATALQELRNMNEGTFSRYGLKHSEFERWSEVQAALKGERDGA